MAPRTLGDMTQTDHIEPNRDDSTANPIFRDPVAYLAGFGIDAEILTETTLPVAA